MQLIHSTDLNCSLALKYMPSYGLKKSLWRHMDDTKMQRAAYMGSLTSVVKWYTCTEQHCHLPLKSPLEMH